MDGRQRSPSYPSTSLEEAIELIKQIYSVERTNAVDRAVVAKAMGYSGISGRSATVLSNLIQYGLLEKTGKNEVRVTRRAIDILYPDTPDTYVEALRAAAQEPELFQKIAERFTDGLPSPTALEAYLIRQGFTHTAIPSATKAFLQTFLFLENATGSESYSLMRVEPVESQQDQLVERSSAMPARLQSVEHVTIPSVSVRYAASSEGYEIRFSQKKIWIGGNVRDQAEADELIAAISALKAMLPVSLENLSTPAQGDLAN